MSDIQPPSYQSLLIRMFFNDQELSTGTAFVVENEGNKYLITNRHNVTGRNQDTEAPLSKTSGIPNKIVILHNVKAGRDDLLRWEPREEPILDHDGNALWYEHPVLGSKADFIALKLKNLDNVIINPYSLNGMGNATGIKANISLRPGHQVSVVGFPFGVQAGGSLAVWATGFIASEMGIDYNELPMFLVDCRTRKGQSGSAVIFNDDNGIPVGGGRANIGKTFTILLGIYSGRINSESDLGMVWKATAIKELIDSIKIPLLEFKY